MSENETSSYDLIPYHSDPFRQTHPSVLATIGTLFGMEPPPVENCRVLEIGCASGGNLIPMSMELPESQFVGIDLSARQIAEGKETISVLGLERIELHARNVMEIGPDFGQFDYIIAHGVYSWVPQEVASKIVEVCAKNLSPNGISYVSYNTLPGWHMRGMIRDMMCYHTRQFEKPAVKIRQSRALISFLAESVPGEKNPYGIYLKNELEMLQKMRDSYIFHEHLERENNPIYFHQFVERAEAQGLQYLGESSFGSMSIAAHDLPPKVMATLQRISPNLIQREQYMDFVRNRTFRQSLLCHKEVQLDRSLDAKVLKSLYVSSAAKPVAAQLDIQSKEGQDFRMGELRVPVRQPITKAAMLHLTEAWPKSVQCEALRAAARSRLDPAEADEATMNRDMRALATSLLSLYALGFVELNVREMRASPAVSERPAASPLVRLQSQNGRLVTNLRHRMITVDEFERRILQQLDGNHDRKQLQEILEGLVANGSLVLRKNGDKTPSAEDIAKVIGEGLDRSLSRFREYHLLVG